MALSDQQKLEERLAHLERHSEELSDVVADQARMILRLQAQVKALIEAEATRQAEAGQAILGDERPPHW